MTQHDTDDEITAERPFERIQPHKDVLEDIELMQDNLAELEQSVRTAEWLALGGRGAVGLDRVDRICDAVERSMPYIRDDIHDLPRGEE